MINNDKEVILIRKQPTEYTVNYPIDGRIKTYVWQGTKGKKLNERAIPFEVFEWLQTSTTALINGSLIIKETEDEEVIDIKENIENIEQIEKSILTKEKISELLSKGNHLSLKKELKKIDDETPEELKEKQKKYIVNVASELGVDSASKRKILVEWAGLDYENADLLFDKVLEDMYKKES